MRAYSTCCVTSPSPLPTALQESSNFINNHWGISKSVLCDLNSRLSFAYLPIAKVTPVPLTFCRKCGCHPFLPCAALTDAENTTMEDLLCLTDNLINFNCNSRSAKLPPPRCQMWKAISTDKGPLLLLPTMFWVCSTQVFLTMPLVKKTHQEATISSSPTYTHPPSTGFYVTGDQTKTRFFVDTSAYCSIHPASPLQKCHLKDVSLCLTAANRSTIATYGMKIFLLALSYRRFSWTFIIADIRVPLSSADFLTPYHLLVNAARSCLNGISSYSSTPLQTSLMPKDITFVAVPSKFQHLQVEYPRVFSLELCQFPRVPPKHGIYHHIKGTGPPMHSHFQRLSPQKLHDTQQTFFHMEELGLCQKAPSSWASALHLVS